MGGFYFFPERTLFFEIGHQCDVGQTAIIIATIPITYADTIRTGSYSRDAELL